MKTAQFILLSTFFSIGYLLPAWLTFQARNPLCNDASFFSDFGSVVTMEKLAKYQPVVP